MKKLKQLLPSLREKKRYVLFEILSNKQHDAKSIINSLTHNYTQFHGELNLAHAGLLPLFDTFSKNKGIIRINNLHVDDLRAALTLVSSIDQEQVIMRSLSVSGVLNKVKNKIAG
ncbi:hypothetical protein HYV79_03795 [Candidatus Woesearchaeota archaeon]|nr:hypothetical protein [Candidatus Woesearchaeota archaeon]